MAFAVKSRSIDVYKRQGQDCPSTKLNHIDEFGNHLCITGCPLFATNSDGIVRTEKVFVRHKDGYRIPILTTVYPIKENGAIIGSVEVFTRNSPKAYGCLLYTSRCV